MKKSIIIYLILATSFCAWAQTGTLEAGMYAIPVDPSTQLATAFLKWSCEGCNCTKLYVSTTPDYHDKLVAQAGLSAETSPNWIQKGILYKFKLYSCDQGTKDKLLDEVTVTGIDPIQKMVGVNKFNLLYQYYQHNIADNSPEARAVHKRLGQKSIHDAAQLGFNFMRVSVSFWSGTDIGIWKNQPASYWAAVDEMLADMSAKNVKIVPVLCWSVGQFSSFTGEPTVEEYINPNSEAQTLQRQFITEFVTRYKNNPTVLFWELQNELNLLVDIPDSKLKTEHLLVWQPAICKLIRSIDPFHMISSGNSDPRPAAWNLWKNNSWTNDTKEQMQAMIYECNRWVDIASSHAYGTEVRYGAPLKQYMADMYEAAKASHKLLYVGEFGEGYPQEGTTSYYAQVLDNIKDIGIEFASPWIWEFYQFNTHEEKEFNIEPSFTHTIINKMQEVNVAMGNPAWAEQSPDITAPMSIISYPYTNNVLTGKDTVWTKASDNNKYIKHVSLNLDGKFHNRSTSFPFKNPVNTSALEECMHKLITRAQDMAGNIGADSVMLFKIHNRPSQPTITVLDTRKATISWKDTYINELAYVLQRKEDNGAWHDLLYLPKQVSTFTDSTLLPNVRYSYRSYAYYTGPKWYGPSAEASFTNIITSTQTAPHIDGEIKMYPNPADNVLTVVLPEASIGIGVTISDISGKELYKTNTNSTELHIPTQAFSAGVYVLKAGTHTNKITINK